MHTRKYIVGAVRKTAGAVMLKGHPYRRITWSEEGRSRTKSISEKNIGWIKEVTQNYRNFKEGQKQIKEYEERLKKLFGKHFKEIIKQTRMKKEYN